MLFTWAMWQQEGRPELKLLYHVPNGGKRDKRTATALRRQGVKAGVPDLCLPVARGGVSRPVHRVKSREKQNDRKAGQMDSCIKAAGLLRLCLLRMGRGKGNNRKLSGWKNQKKGRGIMKIICFINLKGGCAKTTTTLNIAYELQKRGNKILLLDNDKQGNLSKAYQRYDPEGLCSTAKLLLQSQKEPEKIIQSTPEEYGNIDIITANMSLLSATYSLTENTESVQYRKYKDFLEQLQNTYDYCLIDNPPDIALNVINALAAADEVIIPVKIDEWALDGMDILQEQIEEMKNINPGIRLLGTLITSYKNNDYNNAGINWLDKKSQAKILGKIRYTDKVPESTFLHAPAYAYSPRCGAAQDYKNFVTKYLKEQEGK